jgi:hypothetical protein
MNECLQCQAPTKTKFCSKSCAASFNNKKHPKRKPEHNCKKCHTPITCGKMYCSTCSPKKTNRHKKTLQEALYQNKNDRSNKYSYIRWHARKVYFSLNKNPSCHNCGYDKHVEVCHIKAICNHDPKTTIEEVNRPENLIGLCPNCHWEFDKGLLDLE